MSSNIDYAKQAPGATGVNPEHAARQVFEVVDRARAMLAPVDGAPMRKKFAICGFAASSRNAAPFDDPEYLIVGLNQLYRHIPRADVWFDIHGNWREDNVEGTDHPRWLAESGLPVFMIEAEPSIPRALRYPIEEVIEGITGVDYFTSSVAFMLAWAIREIDRQVETELDDEPANGLTIGKIRKRVADAYSQRELAIFGIDLVVGDEYLYQKACVEFILGLAQARGITVRIPPQCALLKQLWRYGYEKEPQAWPIKQTELTKRQGALQHERNSLIARLQTIDGALQENGYWSQVHDLRSKGATVKLNEDT